MKKGIMYLFAPLLIATCLIFGSAASNNKPNAKSNIETSDCLGTGHTPSGIPGRHSTLSTAFPGVFYIRM